MFVFDNYYTVSELAANAYSLILTKLFFPGATLVRRPICVRGKPRMRFGSGFTTGRNCRLETFGSREDTAPKLVIGDRCRIGDFVHIAEIEHIEIGDDCLLASKIFISDLGHGCYDASSQATDPDVAPNDRPLVSSPVHIGDKVWIGEGVSILGGVTIGEGCVIGANSVVTKDVPPRTIAVGSPARTVKAYEADAGGWLSGAGADVGEKSGL